jgi:PAS domain S-box-containing protein
LHRPSATPPPHVTTSPSAGGPAREGDAVADAREAVRRSAERFTRLEALTLTLSRALTATEVAEAVLGEGLASISADGAAVFWLTAAGQLELLHERGFGIACRDGYARFPLEARVPSADAILERRTIWLETAEAIRQSYPAMEAHRRQQGSEAWVAVPLVVDGRAEGALGLTFRRARHFDEEERAFIGAVAALCASAIDRARRYEAERAQGVRAAQDAALLDAIFATAPVGLGFWDRDLRFVRINGALAEMNGLPPEAHLGKTPRELLPGLPADAFEAEWRRILATGEPLLDFEISGETPANPGVFRTWIESWFPVKIGGAPIGIGAVVREVTEQKKAEELQRHLLGIVGHDLRTPLSAVSISAALLARGASSEEHHAKLVGRIRSAAKRMEWIIRDLLDYTVARAGRPIPVVQRRCDLDEICRAAIEEAEAASPTRRFALEGGGDGAGEWDPERLAQVLSNLVANAVKYGAPAETIRLRWRTTADEATIEVWNAGAPIPADVLPHLFEPFRQGNTPGAAVGGIGLGLFIAQQIVVAHGGRVEVRSDAASGTTFTVVLPRTPPGAAAGAR